MIRLAKLLILFTFILGIASSAFPQGGMTDYQIGRLRMEIERTGEIIEQAKEAFRVSNAPAARVALEAAIKLQAGAWENFHGRHYLLSASFAKQAREQAQQSLAYSRVSEQSESLVHRKLEKVQQIPNPGYKTE